MRALLVANPKCGCAKTTLCINLAAGLAHAVKRVVLRFDISEQTRSG